MKFTAVMFEAQLMRPETLSVPETPFESGTIDRFDVSSVVLYPVPIKWMGGRFLIYDTAEASLVFQSACIMNTLGSTQLILLNKII